MVPSCPFYFRVPLLNPNSKKKGTLIVMGLLRNLEDYSLGLRVQLDAVRPPLAQNLRMCRLLYSEGLDRVCQGLHHGVVW